MSDDLFDGPGGDFFTPEDYNNHLLLIKPLQQLYGVKTDFGPKDPIQADVHVLDGPKVGTVLRGAHIYPMALIGQISGNVGSGRFNLGRLHQGVPKPGQKPPWKIANPTPEDQALARRYLDSPFYKGQSAAAAPTPAAAQQPPTATPPAQSDPWGSAPAPAAAAADPWGTSDNAPPF